MMTLTASSTDIPSPVMADDCLLQFIWLIWHTTCLTGPREYSSSPEVLLLLQSVEVIATS